MNILLAFLILNISKSLSTKLLKRELQGYDLAKCNDGSTAAYFYDQVISSRPVVLLFYHKAERNIMIAIPNKSNYFLLDVLPCLTCYIL